MLILQFVFSFFFPHTIPPEHGMRNFKDYAVDRDKLFCKTTSFQNYGMFLYSNIQQIAGNSLFFSSRIMD